MHLESLLEPFLERLIVLLIEDKNIRTSFPSDFPYSHSCYKRNCYGTISSMLHVLTGKAGGRRLKVPKGNIVRPTTSRVKTSMFDTLGNIEGLSVLDIFSGSGTLGIESLSRDAKFATFVEKNPKVYKILLENIETCGFQDCCEPICGSHTHAINRLINEGEKFDLIFIDPPYPIYPKTTISELVELVSDLIEESGTIVIKHNYKDERSPEGFVRRTKSYGDTRVSFFQRGN